MQARNKTVRIIQSTDEVEGNEYVVALKLQLLLLSMINILQDS